MELLNAIEESKPQIKLNLFEATTHQRRLAIQFQRSFENLDEEDYAFVYECLNEYAEIFIVDGTDERMRLQGEQRFEQLVDLLTVLEADYVPQNWDDEDSEESFDDD